MIRTFSRWLLPVALTLLVACSLPPEKPVTIDELMATKIFRIYKIEESPEDVLRTLNRDGEAIVKGERTVRREQVPVWVKILAKKDGIEVADYER